MSASRIPTVLCFDVEDIIAPESDDVSLWLAEILREHHLTGTFMVVGEKARLWEQRGRQEVIEALKAHHLGFHSTWHSVHPTTTEHCLERNFAKGMEALREWDAQGLADADRILGRPLLGWARTGSSWAPSVQGLMGQMGRAYAYSIVRLPGHNVCWYANCLGFYGEGTGGFDDVLYDTQQFEQRLTAVEGQLAKLLTEERRGAEWLCFFVGHPTRIISTMFWDVVNFAKGANPPRSEWKPAPRHDPALIPTMQANFRQLCQTLQADSRLEIVGWGDLIRRYDGQKPFATHAELRDLAQAVADAREVVIHDYFTPGEVLLMLCQAATASQARYVRPRVYGPLTTPPVSSRTEWDAEAVKAAAPAVLTAATSGYLPATVSVAGEAVGLGTYLVALAEAVLGQARVSGPADAPYPRVAEAIAQEVSETLPNWPIHPLNMDLSLLLEQTRLQCWTLKPAWERVEQ